MFVSGRFSFEKQKSGRQQKLSQVKHSNRMCLLECKRNSILELQVINFSGCESAAKITAEMFDTLTGGITFKGYVPGGSII